MIAPVFSLPARVLILLAVVSIAFAVGYQRGVGYESQKFEAYLDKQMIESQKVTIRLQSVAAKVEKIQRERVRTIYLQGAEIEKQVHVFIPPIDDVRFAVSNGWVRIYDAAFSGEDPGAPTELDREPSGIPISAIADVNIHNATSCRQWREQALGWRKYYSDLLKQ